MLGTPRRRTPIDKDFDRIRSRLETSISKAKKHTKLHENLYGRSIGLLTGASKKSRTIQDVLQKKIKQNEQAIEEKNIEILQLEEELKEGASLIYKLKMENNTEVLVNQLQDVRKLKNKKEVLLAETLEELEKEKVKAKSDALTAEKNAEALTQQLEVTTSKASQEVIDLEQKMLDIEKKLDVRRARIVQITKENKKYVANLKVVINKSHRREEKIKALLKDAEELNSKQWRRFEDTKAIYGRLVTDLQDELQFTHEKQGIKNRYLSTVIYILSISCFIHIGFYFL